MKNKVCYIPAIKRPYLLDVVSGGRIVSIAADGHITSAKTVEALEVKVYYKRLYKQLLKRRTTNREL